MIDEAKVYTDKQLLFLDALMGEAKGSIRKAMDVAGYAKTTKISEVVRSLNKEIIRAAEEMLAMNAPKAAFGIIDVLEIYIEFFPFFPFGKIGFQCILYGVAFFFGQNL